MARARAGGPWCRQSVLLAACLAAFTWVAILAWQHGQLSEHVRRSHAPPPPGPPTEQRCDATHVLLRSRCEARVAAARANAVREGMRHAWLGYQAFAWGADEVHPKSQTAKNGIRGGVGIQGMGVSLVDALSTLYLMGLEEEFEQGRAWVAEQLDFERGGSASFFETVIRLLGGLAAAHDLSGDEELRLKAIDLADRLLPAFEAAPTGLVKGLVNWPRHTTEGDDGRGNVTLAEACSNVLEFAAVSRMAGDPKYRVAAERGLHAVHAANTQALLLERVDRQTGREAGLRRGLGPNADSYFEYLIKRWIQGGRSDEALRARWEQSVDEVLSTLLVSPPNWAFAYAGDLYKGELQSQLDHLRCFYPGSVALGVMAGAVKGAKAAQYLRFAQNMTQACFQLYNATASGLGAEEITFDPIDGFRDISDASSVQRPEVAESLFYMWRATRNPRWRDLGWAIFSAIERHTRCEGGYSGASNADVVPPTLDDTTQSWFFAETLKYLYLLFSPDSSLDLTRFVLNTEAHPLKVSTTAVEGGGGGSSTTA